jgi:putative transcriptional regulator
VLRTDHPQPDDISGGHFARRLRDARMAAHGGAGLGQQELADAVGLSQATISDYERGRRRPNLSTLIALSRILAVSTDWLLFGNETPATGGHDLIDGDRGGRRGRPGPDLLDSPLIDLLGLSRLTYLGHAGLIGAGGGEGVATLQAGSEWPVAARHLVAAEERSGYPSFRHPDPQGGLAMSREMCAGAESVILYTGPATADLRPGDLLLIGPPDRRGDVGGGGGDLRAVLMDPGLRPETYAVASAVAPLPPGAVQRGSILAILRRGI